LLLVFGMPYCQRCLSGWGMLRRISQQFHDKGLDIVLVTNTAGYFRWNLLTPPEEADRMRWYFLEHLQLPVKVGVWKSEVTFRADGNRMPSQSPTLAAYRNAYFGARGSPTGILVDQQGKIKTAFAILRE